MTTWWEARAALVTEAAYVVSVQNDCTPAEALARLRLRAEADETDLEDVATTVLALRVPFQPSAVAVT